jgi:hypothetical protein
LLGGGRDWQPVDEDVCTGGNAVRLQKEVLAGCRLECKLVAVDPWHEELLVVNVPEFIREKQLGLVVNPSFDQAGHERAF